MTIQLLRQLLKLNKDLLNALIIISIGFLIGILILITTDSIPTLYNEVRRKLPPYASYQQFKDVPDFTNITLNTLVSSQPLMSYNNNAPYLIIELNSFTCANCILFHISELSNESPYDRLIDNYVANGKANLTWMDYVSTGESDQKNTSMYCVAEQSSATFFAYKEVLYKGYNDTFSVDIAKKYIQETKQNINLDTFASCMTSNKYSSRVKNISTFVSGLQPGGTLPNLLIYKADNTQVQQLDHTTSNQTTYTLLGSISGQLDYNISLQKQITNLIK